MQSGVMAMGGSGLGSDCPVGGCEKACLSKSSTMILTSSSSYISPAVVLDQFSESLMAW